MQRVVTKNCIEFLRQRRSFDVVHRKRATQWRLMVSAVRHTRHAFFWHLNQVGADVDPLDDIAEAREIFAEPTRTTTHVENAPSGRQSQGDGNVGEVAEMTMRVFVHALVFVSGWFVGEIVKGLCPQMMTALFGNVAQVIARGLLVIDALEFWGASIRWPGLVMSVLRGRMDQCGAVTVGQ